MNCNIYIRELPQKKFDIFIESADGSSIVVGHGITNTFKEAIQYIKAKLLLATHDDFFDGSEEKQEREDLEDRGVMEHD